MGGPPSKGSAEGPPKVMFPVGLVEAFRDICRDSGLTTDEIQKIADIICERLSPAAAAAAAAYFAAAAGAADSGHVPLVLFLLLAMLPLLLSPLLLHLLSPCVP